MRPHIELRTATVGSWQPGSMKSMSRGIVGHVLATLLIALSISPAALGAKEADNDATKLKEVLQAWRARQQRIKTVRISCEATTLNPKWPYDTTAAKAQGNYAPDLYPEKDVIQKRSVTFLMDDKGRFRMDTLGGDGGPKAIHQSVYDGTKGVIFTNHHDRFTFPGGQIIKPERYADSKLTQYSSMLVDFRMFDPMVGELSEESDVERLRIVDEPAEYEGNPVIIVELPHQSSQSRRTRWWADPKRDYTIVIQQYVSEGTLLNQTDSHFAHTDGEWLPTAWKSNTLFPDGSIRFAADFKVTACAINQPLKPDAFKIEFVPGTWVVDGMVEGEPSYIIDRQGKRRDILPHEVGSTYEQLFNSRSGEAKPKPKPQEPGAPQARRPFPLLPLMGVAGVLLAAMCVSALIFRRPQIS